MVKFSKRLALILVVFLAFQLVLPGNFFWQNAGGYSDERDAIVEKQLAEIISDNESKGELKEQEREAGLEELVEEKEGREQGVFPEEIEETEEGGFIEKNRVTEQGGFQEENEEKEQYELAEEKEGTEAVGFDVVNYDCDGNIVSVAKKGIYVSEEGFHEYEYVENLPPKIISEPVTFFEIDKRKGELQLLDLSNWKAINLADGLKANWVVDATGTEVLQTVNSVPSVIISDIELTNDVMEGIWRVDTGNDDDFMGFAFGYQDEGHFYLFDWKQQDQSISNRMGLQGMCVKVVNTDETLSEYDFWNTAGVGEHIKTLYSNRISYKDYTDYGFTLKFQPGRFQITIKEGETVIETIEIEDDTYTTGKFGFYNCSQEMVRYKGFQREDLTRGEYVYNVDVLNYSGSSLKYSLLESPATMQIDKDTGKITWLLTEEDEGEHRVTVKVENEEGLYDTQSFTIKVVTDAVAPTVPGNLKIIEKDGASVTLNWNESYDNIKVSGYSIYRDGKIIATVDASSQTYTDIVEPGAYRYFVTAFDPSGNESGSSNEVIFDCEKPSRPGNVVRTNATVSTITISWEPSYDLTGVKGYKVYRDGEMIGVAEEEYFTDSGLEPDTVYTYAVKAFDGYENESEISGKLTAATKADTEPPTVPENLRILLQTGTSIIFNWSESEDNFKVAGYEIYRNGEHVGNSNVPSYTDAGVSAGTTYTYTVRAFDGAGNYSNFSSELIGIPMMPKIVGTEPLDEETIGGLSEKVYVYFLDSGNMTGSSALFEYSRDGITWSKFDSEVHGPNRKDPVTLYFYSNWDLESLKSGDYMVRCTVYDADGNSDERIVSYRVDRTPPEKVKNLNAISDSSSVVLTWDASEIDIPEDDIAPVVLGISPVDGTTFGKNAKITGLFASPYTTNIILMWNDVYDDDFAYFSVEQKDSLDGEYKKAGTIDNRLRMNTVDFMKEEKPKKLMEVTAVGNGWVRLNDESTNLPQNYKDSFEYGTEIKLTAIPDRDSEFAYWEDISNGRMISTNPVYRTIITSGENIKAVFYKKATEETEVFTVVFKDRGGRILKSTNVAKNQPAIPPKDPVMTGYQFVGWDRDFSSVTSNMVISPVFKRLPDKYIVTVEGGRLITGETKGEYKFDMPVKVVANEEEEGMKFSHWTMDGRKVSLEPEYVFFMPKKDIVLTAVFVEDAEIIDTAPFITLSENVIVNKDDKTMIFVANRSVGEGYTLIESGVILLKAGADYEGEITLGTENILRGRIHNDSTDQFYVRKINVADGDIWYGRAYLIYEDGDGNIFTVYSENTAKGIMK